MNAEDEDEGDLDDDFDDEDIELTDEENDLLSALDKALAGDVEADEE